MELSQAGYVGSPASEWMSQIETPSVVIDRARLERNIKRMTLLAHAHGVRLRPHVKTHKSIAIARMQMQHGAVGITASKPDEALVFIAAGIPSVTVAYPLVNSRTVFQLLRAAAYANCDLRLICDSHIGLDAIIDATQRAHTRAAVVVKVDVGLHRCGVDPEGSMLIELADRIQRDASLRFCGIFSHAGHAYSATSRAMANVIAYDERETMLRAAGRLRDADILCEEVSVGSTPTVVACDDFTGITEIRPGNYVFMDRAQLSMGIADDDEIALTVLASVVSVNDAYYIIDAGSKVLSSDRGAHGVSTMEGYGAAYPIDGGDALMIEKLSEEHGFVRRGASTLSIASRVRIIPNHSCVVANLSDDYVVIGDDGSVETWMVDARGKVR